ncbi:MAG: hypothetical protein HY355_03525 [Armatimonadetes bacterium]|nr:hypothetical protein [Armatimonadota bacterium]
MVTAAFPRMYTVTRELPRPRVDDPERAVQEALAGLDLGARARGKRIAVTAGSRGIRDIVPILRGTITHLRRCGADPMVVAAMGSHGGGTSEGQRRVLTHLGVTEDAVGAPISTQMEAVDVIGKNYSGTGMDAMSSAGGASRAFRSRPLRASSASSRSGCPPPRRATPRESDSPTSRRNAWWTPSTAGPPT